VADQAVADDPSPDHNNTRALGEFTHDVLLDNVRPSLPSSPGRLQRQPDPEVRAAAG